MEFSAEKTYGIFSTPQNKKIIARIKASGAKLIEFTNGEILKKEAGDAEKRLIGGLAQFDWIVFTDIFAVGFFIEELAANDIDLYEMDDLRVCSYGESVADRLRFVQLHSDIIAQKIDESLIADAIVQYIGNAGELANRRILIVKTGNRNLSLRKILSGKNLTVEEIVTGEFLPPKQNEITLKKALLKGGTIDEFVFCAVEDVFQFQFQFRAELSDKKLFDTVWGADEITLKTLDEFGIKGFYLNK